MVGVLILTHGGVAPELLATARVISGNLEAFESLALDWSDGFDVAHGKVGRVLRGLDQGQGILILTDILGGTPFNVAMAFREAGQVEIVSGVNLPMVVRLGCLVSDEMPLTELTRWLRDKGRSSICSSDDLPRANPGPEPCEDNTDSDHAGSPGEDRD